MRFQSFIFKFTGIDVIIRKYGYRITKKFIDDKSWKKLTNYKS